MTMIGTLFFPLTVGLLTVVSVGAVFLFFFGGQGFNSARAERRFRQFAAPLAAGAAGAVAGGGRAAEQRRKNIQDQLKELEGNDNRRQFILSPQVIARGLQEAGLDWELQTYWIISGACMLAGVIVGLSAGAELYVAVVAGLLSGVVLPRAYVSRAKQQRYRNFIKELPNAIDMIVRGTRAGLPLGACVKIVAKESRQPVCDEFQRVIDTQALGVPFGQAFGRLPKRINLPEARFLAIAIAIQQEAGGSLSETLENLSRVLRSRETMRGKIKALSSEAKTSAGIIGALPVVLSIGLYFLAPDYIGVLITDPTGNLVVGGAIAWMTIGIFVMRAMVNFKI